MIRPTYETTRTQAEALCMTWVPMQSAHAISSSSEPRNVW
jgi:hypothetical protein